MSFKNLHRLQLMAFGVVAITLVSVVSAVACDLSIVRADADRGLAYKPFSGLAAVADAEIEILNNGAEECVFSLAAQSEDRGPHRFLRFGPNALRYELRLDNGRIVRNDASTPNGAFRLAAGAGARTTVTMRVEISRGQVVDSGVYSDRLNVAAYALEGRAERLVDEYEFDLGAIVEPSAQINIAGASGARFGFSNAYIDFGELEPGEIRRTILQVRSTGSVSFALHSENGGQLRQTTRPDLAGIPYELHLDGQLVELETGPATMRRNPTISPRGSSYPLTIRIGRFESRAAGRYEDIVTISVTAD